ncbi:hypothetical protein [Mesorhizobium sp. SARCC-RB16n]|uniref:hypothetical protein n=1 Tax=Mesorhizobium sp. SARCC-RB16n TaxID=2116687 RepID=UPI00122F850B|nr:hypothetical protein [Mesorhizobium sp. SARCC-RB16n]
MPMAKPKDETHETESVSLLGREELVRYAIDCLRIEGSGRLSPRDRARLASASAVLKDISQDLKADAQPESEESGIGIERQRQD